MRLETRAERFGRWKGSREDIILMAKKVSELARAPDGAEGTFRARAEWRIRREETWGSPDEFENAMSADEIAGADEIRFVGARSDDDYAAVVIRPPGQPHAVFVAVEGRDPIWVDGAFAQLLLLVSKGKRRIPSVGLGPFELTVMVTAVVAWTALVMATGSWSQTVKAVVYFAVSSLFAVTFGLNWLINRVVPRFEIVGVDEPTRVIETGKTASRLLRWLFAVFVVAVLGALASRIIG